MKKKSTPKTERYTFAEFLKTYLVSIIIVFVFVLWITWNIHTGNTIKELVFTKTMLAEYYGIDKKTLNKWVKYLGTEVFSDFKVYSKKRKLSSDEYYSLIEVFGDPEDYPIMTKKQIVENAEGSYRSLKESITQFPHKYPITPEAFHTLQKFPPNISEAIVKVYD